MNKILILSLLLTSGVASAFGLEDKVAFESVSHKNRIAILQEAENCIQNAQSHEDYEECEKKEKQGREEHKKEMFSLRKDQFLKKIDDRLASVRPGSKWEIKLTEAKSCLQNAQNRDEAKKCRPNRR